jgi:hydroxyacylglutathione hydrolase
VRGPGERERSEHGDEGEERRQRARVLDLLGEVRPGHVVFGAGDRPGSQLDAGGGHPLGVARHRAEREQKAQRDREVEGEWKSDAPTVGRRRPWRAGAIPTPGSGISLSRRFRKGSGAGVTVENVIFRQLVDDDLGCASYLVGDEQAGVAVLVDPAYAIEPYLEQAAHDGVRIVRVLETHTHADHVSGHGRLALEHDVPVSIHPAAEPDYPSDALADGDELELGEVVVTVLHTPGHRPEHCAFAVADRSRAVEPWLVLTGDSLFVGDAARPDLAIDAHEGAEGLFSSLQRLLQLQDGVEVYPGHVAGSLCGAGMSSKASSTIGFERRFNHALALGGVEDFVADSVRSAGVRPPNVAWIVGLNRGPFLGRPQPLVRLDTPGEARVLDVRPAEAFAAGHVAGALSVPLTSSAFGTKAGFLFSPEDAIAIHAATRREADEAARRLEAVGLLRLAGYLDDPPTPERVEPVELEELERLVAAGAVELVDVREADERDSGYIPGSRHVPYRLVGALADEFENGKPVVTICESGSRAGIAASVLAAAGVQARPVLTDGIPAWSARGGRVVAFRRCGT